MYVRIYIYVCICECIYVSICMYTYIYVFSIETLFWPRRILHFIKEVTFHFSPAFLVTSEIQTLCAYLVSPGQDSDLEKLGLPLVPRRKLLEAGCLGGALEGWSRQGTTAITDSLKDSKQADFVKMLFCWWQTWMIYLMINSSESFCYAGSGLMLYRCLWVKSRIVV